jgi:adenosylcobinamide amidohydrolase
MSVSALQLPDTYKDRVEQEEVRHRLDALTLATKAHEAGDIKENVAQKATWYLQFLKTGDFKPTA